MYFVLEEVEARLLFRVPCRSFLSFFCFGRAMDCRSSFSLYVRGRLPDAMRDDLRERPGSLDSTLAVGLLRLFIVETFRSGDGGRSLVDVCRTKRITT